jgi:hypothetical protein
MSNASTDHGSNSLTTMERVVLVATVVLCRLVALRACSIYDDAFITFRYALNLAAGRGLVFNPGEPWEPVLGTTTPAFAVLLAGFAKAGIGPVAAALSINVACDALSAALIASLCGARRRVAVIAVLAFACLPQAVRIALGGMESSLFVLCGLAACQRMFAAQPFVAGILAAAACVVRPEGVLLVLALVLERLRRPRELARFVVPIAIVGCATVSVLLAVYGDIIPQSVRAKSTMHAEHRAGQAIELCARILAQSFLPHWSLVVFVPFVLVGLVVALRRTSALRAFSLFALAITASYLLARPHPWGWYFHVQLVAWTMWLGLGVDAVLANTAAGRAIAGMRPIEWIERRDVAVLPAFVFACVACVSGLRPSPVPVRVYEPMQAWARETSAREPGARILAADIGAIGYAWNGTVLDSEGLTWPAAVAYKFSNRMIAEMQPEYLLIVAEYPRLAHFYRRPDLFALYEPIRRFSVDGETDLSPALEDVPHDWRQDYIVYRRKQP